MDIDVRMLDLMFLHNSLSDHTFMYEMVLLHIDIDVCVCVCVSVLGLGLSTSIKQSDLMFPNTFDHHQFSE